MNSRPPPFNRILESSLYVSSLERSIEFYRRVFDLEVMLRDERMCALIAPARQVLLLFRLGGSTRAFETSSALSHAWCKRIAASLLFDSPRDVCGMA
jgi:catechol-2,3-dioxygenase